MTNNKTRFANTPLARRSAIATALLWAPLGAVAQETSNAAEDEAYRLAPIIVNSNVAVNEGR